MDFGLRSPHKVSERILIPVKYLCYLTLRKTHTSTLENKLQQNNAFY